MWLFRSLRSSVSLHLKIFYAVLYFKHSISYVKVCACINLVHWLGAKLMSSCKQARPLQLFWWQFMGSCVCVQPSKHLLILMHVHAPCAPGGEGGGAPLVVPERALHPGIPAPTHTVVYLNEPSRAGSFEVGQKVIKYSRGICKTLTMWSVNYSKGNGVKWPSEHLLAACKSAAGLWSLDVGVVVDNLQPLRVTGLGCTSQVLGHRPFCGG